MFYILTRRYYKNKGAGSVILGIYTSLEEAEMIMSEYLTITDNEIIEILKLDKNVRIKDIEKYSTGKYGKVKNDYFHDINRGSKVVHYEHVNRPDNYEH